MKRVDLRTAFVVVAVVELLYGAAALLVPPSQVAAVLGWHLTADGQWVTKLLGLALLAQAGVAWVLRRQPIVAVAWIFAAYQAGAATADWVMWLALADQGIFADPQAQISVAFAVVLHYGIAVLLAATAVRHRRLAASHA